jgi:prepilin-type N-terminal cleavage/methylation domain-containing protein
MLQMGTPERRDERGFTLLELMSVAAIIAILAAIAVPWFFNESRKGKGKTEVTAMFGELSTKEEQYKVDNNQYFPGAGGGTTLACPATSTGALQDVTACAQPGNAWDTLRVTPPQSNVYCSYVITSGLGGSTPSPPVGFTMCSNGSAACTTPIASWYFITANCTMNVTAAVHSSYFMSSMDSSLQVQNEGQ